MIDLGINLFQEIAALGGGGGFSITNSLRFNDNDSAYLSRTPSVAGDRKTWTWSGWVKRGNLGTRQIPLAANDGTKGHSFEIDASNKLNFYSTGAGASINLIASPVLRDVAGWYHIILVADTTQATASDRFKFYVNGVQLTDFDTASYPSQNADLEINNNILHYLGNRPAVSFYFDGYMADVNFIDGQALTADDFGQIDATTGEWSPKKYSGTYGTNGFYLPFNGNANDDSGNGNNWTENNLASTDYMIDTPTNNFSTWNPLNNIQSTSLISFSEGNLLRSESTATNTGNTSTIAPSSGKWYWESYIATSTNTNNYAAVGRLGSSYLGVSRGGTKVNLTGTASTYGGTGTLIGVAIDLDAGTFDIYENGALDSSLTFTPTGEPFSPAAIDGTTTTTTFALIANFGADSSFAGNKTRQGNTDANGIGDFYYTPPTGYLALCTDNLPAPAIEQPETQFNVVTYAGTGTTNPVSGVGFQPDFVWIKNRSAVASNKLFDVVRGAGQQLESDTTNAEATNSNFSSFDSDGFTVVGGTAYNLSGNNYVAWCWKAGGTAVTNTDGSVNSQVSANVSAGFSIVEFNPNLVILQSCTVGHGLSQAPELIITKSRTNAINWWTWTTVIDGSYDYLALNTTAAKTNDTTTPSSPTSSVFSMNYAFTSTSTSMIAYCFHSVEGFSKIGTYVGNGSADGPFVYTGFKPAFVIVKSTDISANWVMYDNERTPVNQINTMLFSNSSGADYTDSTIGIDFLSNGFKLRSTNNNTNGNTNSYIYMAFAEHPFKEALAR